MIYFKSSYLTNLENIIRKTNVLIDFLEHFFDNFKDKICLSFITFSLSNRDHLFSTSAKFFEKLTFHTP